MSDVAAAGMNALLFISGASLGYALHSTIVTAEFSPLFVTGLATLSVWLALRGAEEGSNTSVTEVDG